MNPIILKIIILIFKYELTVKNFNSEKTNINK